ncbi:MAG: hypothetical protein OXE97_11600 [Gammaproteobacteria bacterium]|nr:hypothetical protein [Gammaproteobacteria bacterium]MCY4281928.1 hypothetical protein [Gammaproteobacteria bacterium]
MNKLSDVTSIIISIISVGVLLAGLILNGQSGIRGEMTGIKGEIGVIKEDVTDLQQRTARIEGQLALLIEAWNVNMPLAPEDVE